MAKEKDAGPSKQDIRQQADALRMREANDRLRGLRCDISMLFEGIAGNERKRIEAIRDLAIRELALYDRVCEVCAPPTTGTF